MRGFSPTFDCRLWLSTLTLLAMGCSESAHAPPVAVAGLVNLDGQPIPYARITFAPDWSKEFRATANVVDGRFELSARDGLKPGKYDVCVLPYEPEAEELMAAATEKRPSPVKARGLVPPSYQKRGVLQTEFTAETAKELVFDLKSQKNSRSK